jgi:hypothetical protein
VRWTAYVSALGLALALVLLPATLAGAEFRGTDMWSNIAPQGPGGLADRHPISYYTLDYHVDGPSVGFGGVDAGDVPSMVGQALVSWIFAIAAFFMRLVILAFDWGFNVDIINGRTGAISPVGEASENLYSSTFKPLLRTAILIFGGWLLYKIIGRKFGEAGSGFVRAACLTAIAIAIIFNTGDTIGKAASLANAGAGAIASGTTGANGGQAVSDRLFETFIYKPWAVLQFGGLKRCVSSETKDGFPIPVGGDDPSRAICRNVLRKNESGHGGYAPTFLNEAPGSKDRKELYEDIKDGKGNYDKADAPAVDMMQAGGTVQRLVFTALIVAGMIAGILLLGLICVVALFAQLGLLVCAMATPAMVIAAIFPGLHGIFWSWLGWIGKFLIAKVMYALMLSAALGVSAALQAVGGEGTGYLFAFGLQAVLFLGLFIKRKALTQQLTSRREHNKAESSTKSFITGAATAAVGAASAPVAAASGLAQRVTGRQQAATNPDSASAPGSDPNPPPTTGSDPPSTGSKMPVDSSSPPASAGREYSPNPPDPQALPVTSDADQVRRFNESSTTVATMEPDNQRAGEEPVPTRSFKEEYEQAREASKPREYGQQRPPKPVDPVERDRHSVHQGSTAASYADQVKQERAKTPSS